MSEQAHADYRVPHRRLVGALDLLFEADLPPDLVNEAVETAWHDFMTMEGRHIPRVLCMYDAKRVRATPAILGISSIEVQTPPQRDDDFVLVQGLAREDMLTIGLTVPATGPPDVLVFCAQISFASGYEKRNPPA